ncbi:MAG: hypothetical protein ACP5MI_09550 [Candidatus Kryptoniota bacterium]
MMKRLLRSLTPLFLARSYLQIKYGKQIVKAHLENIPFSRHTGTVIDEEKGERLM